MPDIDWSSLMIGMLGGDRREQEIARLAAGTGAWLSVARARH
jgi:hypothetical protein